MSAPPANNMGEASSSWKDSLTNNTANNVTKMTPKDWIRMIVIVGAYLLIRPFLVKLGARQQRKVHEREAARIESELTEAALHPNQLRGGKVEIPDLDDSDEERNASVRQRKSAKDTKEEEEEVQS